MLNSLFRGVLNENGVHMVNFSDLVFNDLQPKRGFSRFGWVCLHWIHRFQESTPYWLFSLGTSGASVLLEEPFWDVDSAAFANRCDLRPLNEVGKERGSCVMDIIRVRRKVIFQIQASLFSSSFLALPAS